jgi:hypothetical protein
MIDLAIVVFFAADVIFLAGMAAGRYIRRGEK